MSGLKLFLDMDGVLADFATGLKSALLSAGYDDDVITNQWSCWNQGLPCPIPDEEFWGPVNRGGEEFWERLPRLPWVDDLVALAEDLCGDDWHVLSAPSRCPTSYTGKIRWLHREFGRTFDRFLLTPHKYLFAKVPGAVLVDDRDKNVHDFLRAGGRAVLFPQEWNAAAEHSRDPMNYVREQLKEVSNASVCR